MSQQNYDSMIASYLTQPVQVVSAAHAVDEMFAEYDLPHLHPAHGGSSLNSGFWVPLHIVCASVYEPHRSIPETHKRGNPKKLPESTGYVNTMHEGQLLQGYLTFSDAQRYVATGEWEYYRADWCGYILRAKGTT